MDDDDFEATLELIVEARVAEYHPDRPIPYGLKVRTSVIDEHEHTIRMLLTDGNTPDHTARHILGVNLERPDTPRPIPWCQNECECDGTGFIETPRGFAPCPHRHGTEETG